MSVAGIVQLNMHLNLDNEPVSGSFPGTESGNALFDVIRVWFLQKAAVFAGDKSVQRVSWSLNSFG